MWMLAVFDKQATIHIVPEVRENVGNGRRIVASPYKRHKILVFCVEAISLNWAGCELI